MKSLSRDEMKKVMGGTMQTFICNYKDVNGVTQSIKLDANNVNGAQALGDYLAWSDEYTDMFPSGVDCPGAE